MEIVKFTHEYSNLTSAFDCGNIILNNFIKSGDALDKNQGITYILLSDEKDFIIGYYNIEASKIDLIEKINETVYYQPMGGSVNINYLAIHKQYQKTKIAEMDSRKIYLGDILLNDCEQRILFLRKSLGISFITLCSTQEGFHLYHNRNSYEHFEEDMYISVKEDSFKGYRLYKTLDELEISEE